MLCVTYLYMLYIDTYDILCISTYFVRYVLYEYNTYTNDVHIIIFYISSLYNMVCIIYK